MLAAVLNRYLNKMRQDLLEILNTFNALGLFVGVNKAAESRSELFATRSVGHSSQAGTIPIDLSSLWIESSLLICFFLKPLNAICSPLKVLVDSLFLRKRRLPLDLFGLLQFLRSDLLPLQTSLFSNGIKCR